MAECLPEGEVKLLLGVASGASLSTSGLQFLGFKAAPHKAHTQRGLGPFRVALPYWVPTFHKRAGDWDTDGSRLMEQHLHLGN